jgi:hypothetical protein
MKTLTASGQNTMKTFRMVQVTSYGKDIYRNEIIASADLSTIKAKYLSIAGNECAPIFDRNANDNLNHFTLPYSYNTIHVYSI